jgi:hypothetical protein
MSYRIRSCYLVDVAPLANPLTKAAQFAPDLSLQPSLARVSVSPAGMEDFRQHLSRAKSAFSRAALLENVGAVVRGEFWEPVQDRRTGRIFTPITSLNSWMRPHLLIDGAPTVEIDIRNSQPYFLAALYPIHSSERYRFVEKVTSGHFYESLAGKSLSDTERAKFKRQVFQKILFGRPENHGRLWMAFASTFPELAAIVERLKWDSGHNALALALQTLEARAIIDGVMAECERAGVPILTVHDSAIARKEDALFVEGLIRRKCAEVVGATPSLKLAV